jgi:hypothetical protein
MHALPATAVSGLLSKQADHGACKRVLLHAVPLDRSYQALRQLAQPNVCIIVRMELGKPPPEDGRLKEELDGFSFTALAVPDNWSRPSSAAGSPRCA